MLASDSMDFFYLLQKVANLCKTVFVAFSGKCVFGAFENKSLFFHNLTNPRFAQKNPHFSGHMCPNTSNSLDRKRIAHILRIGFNCFDKTSSIIGGCDNRPAATRLVVKSAKTIFLEDIEPIVNTLLVASKYFRNLWYRITHRAKPNCLCPLSDTIAMPFAIQIFDFLMFFFGQFSYKSLWPHADTLHNPLIIT